MHRNGTFAVNCSSSSSFSYWWYFTVPRLLLHCVLTFWAWDAFKVMMPSYVKVPKCSLLPSAWRLALAACMSLCAIRSHGGGRPTVCIFNRLLICFFHCLPLALPTWSRQHRWVGLRLWFVIICSQEAVNYTINGHAAAWRLTRLNLVMLLIIAGGVGHYCQVPLMWTSLQANSPLTCGLY